MLQRLFCAMGLVLAGTALAQPAADATPAPAAAGPNIIWIMADDLGWGDLGVYGQQQIQTPALDALAAQGMRFTQAYAGNTVCAPSRAALMTGKHMGHNLIRGNGDVPLRPQDVTVAEVLKGAGYRTALIGKWGLGEPETTGIPTRQGFDYFFGYLNQGHAHDYYPEYLWENETRVALDNVSGPHKGVCETCKTYSHDLFIEKAVDYLRTNQDERFFLYLALTIPHANNERGYVTGDGMEVPDHAPYADRDWPSAQKGHAAMITRMDRDLGRLVALLVELGIEKDTLVFFTSDNGPLNEGGGKAAFFDSNGPLRGHKRDLYEGGIRVPMIAYWPGTIAAGTVSDVPWAFWDFLPTAAELAQASAPAEVDGVSVAPVLRGVAQELPRDHFYWEFHEGGFLQAVRWGDWKAVRKGGAAGTMQLYNLREDLAEENDIAADHPEQVAHAAELMVNARTPNDHWPGR